MSEYLRFLPLMLWVGVTSYLTPAWESSTPVGFAGLMSVMVFAGCVFWVTGKIGFQGNSLIFVVGMLPDMVITIISYRLVGSWSFEANAWVGSTGNVLLIVPFTLGMAGAIYLLRNFRSGRLLMRICACMRAIALWSHLVLWLYL